MRWSEIVFVLALVLIAVVGAALKVVPEAVVAGAIISALSYAGLRMRGRRGPAPPGDEEP
jgi:hypothetical protein